METIPAYIPVTFALTTFLAFFFIARATRFSKPVILVLAAWLLGQALLSRTGFYTKAGGVPPRFVFLLLPPLVFVIVFFLTAGGRKRADGMETKILTLSHVVRLPVEIVLYWLMLYKAVPQVMTFEGRNLDILCGITAPVVFYFGYIKKTIGRAGLIAWNLAGLLLLGNIVVTAVLAAPFRFQQFGFDQPNIALFYFPFVWLPAFVVPAALFSHLVSLWQLIGQKKKS